VPQLSGTIEVEAPQSGPLQVDVRAASDALKQALGVDIDLKVTEQSE
jgi:hypothetical protein